jgi:uncharacterized integral membrane protein (TIGR00697 family)
MDSSRSYRYLDLVTAAFVGVLVVSNVASSAKIVDLGFSLFGIPMAFDGGTLLFPVSYIFGDILTEVYGFRTSRRVIWTGFVALAASSLVFFALRALPGDASWEGYAGQAAYDAILGGMSSGGIVAASLAGFLMGELSNSLVLARMKVLTGGKALWARTIGSTLVGQLVDTLAFVLVASAAGVFGWELFASLVLTNYVFKCLVEAVMTPATYRAVRLLKEAEGIDAYDRDLRISLRPLRRER